MKFYTLNKLCPFILLALFFSNIAFAKENKRTQIQHYKKHWTSSKLMKKDTLIKGQKLQVKALRRWVRAKNKKGILREWPVADVTVTHINDKAPLLPLAYIGKQYVKYQPEINWKVVVSKGNVFITGLNKKSNRIMIANFKKVKDGHVYTYGLIRPGYAKQVYQEVLDLNYYTHQYFNTNAKPHSKKKTVLNEFINWFSISTAHAQSGNPNIDELFEQASESQIEDYLSNSDVPIDISGDVIVDGAVEINGEVEVTYQMDQAQHDSLIQESQGFQDTANDATSTLNESVNTVANTVDENADKFVEESKRWNRTAEKAVDIKHMSKLAFAMSASAVMGGYVANLAISGFGKAVSAIIEFFTEDKLRAMRLADFANAKKMFGPLEAITENLEDTMDKFITGHDYLANLDGKATEDVLSRLKAEQDQKIADLTEQIDASITSRPCKIQLRILRDKEMKSLTDIQGVMDYVAKQGDDVVSDIYFCERLDEMMNNIVDAEWQLFTLKSTILDARSFVYQNLQKQVEDMDERMERLNSKSNRKKVVSALEDFYDELEDIEDDKVDWRNKKGFVKSCMKGEGPLGKYISQAYGGSWYNIFSAFTRKKKCKEAYQELIIDKNDMNKKKIKRVADKMIEEAEEEVKKLKVRQAQMPTKTVMNKLKRMNSWFNQFQNDLVCQSHLEEGSEKGINYNKCMGMISAPFRSLVKAREKGEAQWKSRQCERRMKETSADFIEYSDESLMAFIEKDESKSEKKKTEKKTEKKPKKKKKKKRRKKR